MLEKPNGAFQVSMRASLANKTGAAELVSLFATGGGRKAAGINELPRSGLDLFFVAFSKQYAKHEKESDSFT